MSDKVNPTGFWFSVEKPQTHSDYIAFAFFIGFNTGINGVNGHELLHHKEWWNKVLGILPLTKLMYTQFIDEHLKGHHKTISTLEDPATSRKNESLYAFIPRSIYGSLTNVWAYENKKISDNYGEDANMFIRILCNKMVWYEVFHASILGSIYYFLGWESIKFNLLVIVFGIYWLETVNYIEHYGILRKKD
jgi:alkane 1-monooxygenase